MIKVFVVEDDEVYASYLRLLVDTTEGLEFVGQCCAKNVLDEILAAHPDVVLMDVRMPDCDGIEVTRRVTSLAPEIAVLIVTGWVGMDSVLEAMKAHAAGYLPKSASDAAIVSAIHATVRGEPVFDLAFRQ